MITGAVLLALAAAHAPPDEATAASSDVVRAWSKCVETAAVGRPDASGHDATGHNVENAFQKCLPQEQAARRQAAAERGVAQADLLVADLKDFARAMLQRPVASSNRVEAIVAPFFQQSDAQLCDTIKGAFEKMNTAGLPRAVLDARVDRVEADCSKRRILSLSALQTPRHRMSAEALAALPDNLNLNIWGSVFVAGLCKRGWRFDHRFTFSDRSTSSVGGGCDTRSMSPARYSCRPIADLRVR